MAVSPARAAAIEILLRVEREQSYASELLHSARFAKLSTADHGLATQLVMGVLRWRSWLDPQLAKASSQKLQRLDAEVLTALAARPVSAAISFSHSRHARPSSKVWNWLKRRGSFGRAICECGTAQTCVGRSRNNGRRGHNRRHKQRHFYRAPKLCRPSFAGGKRFSSRVAGGQVGRVLWTRSGASDLRA